MTYSMENSYYNYDSRKDSTNDYQYGELLLQCDWKGWKWLLTSMGKYYFSLGIGQRNIGLTINVGNNYFSFDTQADLA